MGEKMYERNGVLAVLTPQSVSAGTANTGYIDMSKFEKVMFVIQAGVLGASATVDFAVKGDTASGGSYATTITGKTITQLTKADSDDGKQVIVEVAAIEVLSQGFRYIRGLVTVGAAACLLAVLVMGQSSHYDPVTLYDATTVDEIVD